MDIHNYEKRLSRELELVESANIPERNKELIKAFKRDLVVEGVKAPRIVRYLISLRLISQWKPKPFDEWTIDDLKDVIVKIESNNYSVQTINEYRKCLRKFFKWLKGEDWEGLKLVRGERKDQRKPEILTEDEIKMMIKAADNPRDKAIIAVGYEGGLRIGELASITIKDIIWTNFGCKIKVRGKTGERVVSLYMAAPYLKLWIEHHPNREDPNSPVFVGIGSKNHGKPMTYKAFEKIIKKAAKKAGIKKKVYPHVLRHTRATVLANVLTEAQMCIYFGWAQGSDMPARYVHLSGRDVDQALMKYYGLAEEESEPVKLKPIECPRCKEMNPPTARFCQRCGLLLDEKERLQLQFEEDRVISDIMLKILESSRLREKFEAIMQLVKEFEGNPKANELLKQLIDEIVSNE